MDQSFVALSLSSRGTGDGEGRGGGGGPTGVCNECTAAGPNAARSRENRWAGGCSAGRPCYRHRSREATVAPEEFRLPCTPSASGFQDSHHSSKELHHMSFADLGVSRPVVGALKK